MMCGSVASPIVDLTDAQLRARGGLKWTSAPFDVLPAWVAEADVAPASEIEEALSALVRRGEFGYPPMQDVTGVPEALGRFASDRWGWRVRASQVVLTGDVMSGIHLCLSALCERAPVVIPTPAYPPFFDIVRMAGFEQMVIPHDPDGPAELDLPRINDALEAGARTVLLCNPHNPWGRAFSRSELESLRDIVTRHHAKVISDEVHGPLVLAGAKHVPYASLEGTNDHAATVLSASKAWNIPGLKCAQIVTANDQDAAVLRGLPLVANHGLSTPGIAATVAAYDSGRPWLDAWLLRLGQNRDFFSQLVSDRLPGVRMRHLEATYLAWLDVRALVSDSDGRDPSELALERGRVMVSDGRAFGAGGEGHVRVNIATAPERLERIVDGLAQAWLAE